MSDPNRTQLGAPPTLDPNRTVMGSAPTLNATQTIVPVQCPVCKSHNPPGVMFCVECGLILDRALPDDAFGAPVVRLPVLVEASGREHPIRAGENVVGREADILLSDPKVSRRHAVIVSVDGALEVEDLGSTNGTLVNGEPLEPGARRPLSQGDKVAFGGIELSVSMPGLTGKTAALPTPPEAAEPTEPLDEGAASAPEEVPAATLFVDGAEFPLRFGVNSFGRKADNDVQLSDPYVSGRHGSIEIDAEGAFLTDLGSTNGTFLNGEKLEPEVRTQIGPEDEIRVGGMALTVRLAAESD